MDNFLYSKAYPRIGTNASVSETPCYVDQLMESYFVVGLSVCIIFFVSRKQAVLQTDACVRGDTVNESIRKLITTVREFYNANNNLFSRRFS